MDCEAMAFTVSDVLAALAIFISVWTLISEKRSKRVAHEFELFREIYQKHLIIGIPEARNKIHIGPDGILRGEDALIEELCIIRKESMYFKYTETDFFEALKEKLWDVEDYLVMLDGPILEEDRINFECEMQQRIEKIYRCLTKRF